MEHSPIHKHSSFWAHVLIVVAMIIVASSFPIGQAIAPELPPAVLMFVRFAIAALCFVPVVVAKSGAAFPTRESLLGYLVISVPLATFFWCMFESLRYTSAVNTGALYTIVPAITAVYALLINHDKASKVRWLGLGIGTIGALWIVFRGDLSAFLALRLNAGDMVFIVGCFFMGAYGPLVKYFHKGEGAQVVTFWVLLFCAFWLGLASIPDLAGINWSLVPPKVYVGIMYLAIFSTLISFVIMQYCIVRLGATRVAAYSFLTPLFVIVISVSLGMAEFQPSLLPGIGLVLIAMWLVQRESLSETAGRVG